MKKIVTILGARPQFIKAAAVSRAAKSFPVKEVIVHTGQHFDKNMSDIFFEQMEIPLPDYRLEINSLSHGAMTGRMLEEVEKVLLKEKPDLVMVYGDTNSTLAGALAASKLHIPAAHVEAGLRSFNMAMPEEINRILTDRISDYLFCPTETAVRNLEVEGFKNLGAQLHLVGDVMYDAALYYEQQSEQVSTILKELGLTPGQFVLCTVHRQENTDLPARLGAIIAALNEINKTVQVILPLHPRTRKILKEKSIVPAFEPIDPVGYFDILQLLKHSKLVLTDSGGMQKEAYFFSKYCITLRDETEWVELIQNKVNYLAGADKKKILELYHQLRQKSFPITGRLYGEGRSSEKILDILTR
jgi:UDP-GlcNAc3NAcA epimerase